MDFDFSTETINSNIANGGVITISGVGGLSIPAGTTAERPAGATGMIRFNSENGVLEIYSGGVWGGGGALFSSIAVSSATVFPTTTGLTATGSDQAGALGLSVDYNIVTTVAASTGVRLPTAVAGRRIIVTNRGANTLNVYPATGGVIDSLATNAATTVAAGKSSSFVATSGTQWYTYTSMSTGGGSSAGSSGDIQYSDGASGFTASANLNYTSGALCLSDGSGNTVIANTAGTTRLTINSSGAWGVAGANYGSSGQVLTSNGNAAVPTWQTPTSSSGGSAVTTAITQANTFAVGNAVYYTGSAWSLAKADSPNTLAIGVVSAATGSDFTLTMSGVITGLSGLTAGEYYYVSDVTAGALTATEPTTYSNPVLFATSTTSGIVLPYRPAAYDGGSSTIPEVLTANTTKTVKTAGGDFTDLQSAIDWAQTVMRVQGVSISINVDPGVWTHTSAVTFSQTGGQVRINGTYYTTTLTSVASSSGSAGNYSYVLNVGSTTNITVGDWVGIDYTSGGVNGQLLQGGFEVTGVGSGQITIKNTHNELIAAASGECTGTIYIFKTILKFNTCSGLTNGTRGALITLSNIAIVGNDANAAYIGLNCSSFSYTVAGGNLSSDRILVGGFATGVALNAMSWAIMQYIYVGRCSTTYTGGATGIYLVGMANGDFNGARVNCHSAAPTNCFGAQIDGSNAYIQNAYIVGVGVSGGAGIYAQRGSIINAYATQITACLTGISATYVTQVDFQTGTTSGCTTSTTPATNTAGNNGSYITS